ncbi:MAG: hypothetical protein ACKO38_01260 [Planctomycetota bacterium]
MTFEYAWFESAGPIGDLAMVEALQDLAAYLGRTGRINAAAGEHHPVG